MKLQHQVIDLNEFQDNNSEAVSEKLILLKEGDTKEESMVAQSISLDIRGNFGDFLDETECDEYHWRGNQFEINISGDKVIITNFLVEDGTTVSIDLKEWIEALNDWKAFYLEELGFSQFTRTDASHLFGVLIMIYDKLSSPSDITSEIIIESIKGCSKRYGIKIQTIQKQCKNVIQVHYMWEFYKWVYDVFNSIPNAHTEILKNKEIDIQKAIKQYFNIDI